MLFYILVHHRISPKIKILVLLVLSIRSSWSSFPPCFPLSPTWGCSFLSSPSCRVWLLPIKYSPPPVLPPWYSVPTFTWVTGFPQFESGTSPPLYGSVLTYGDQSASLGLRHTRPPSSGLPPLGGGVLPDPRSFYLQYPLGGGSVGSPV